MFCSKIIAFLLLAVAATTVSATDAVIPQSGEATCANYSESYKSALTFKPLRALTGPSKNTFTSPTGELAYFSNSKHQLFLQSDGKWQHWSTFAITAEDASQHQSRKTFYFRANWNQDCVATIPAWVSSKSATLSIGVHTASY